MREGDKRKGKETYNILRETGLEWKDIVWFDMLLYIMLYIDSCKLSFI